MPELPEVEIVRQSLSKKIKQKKVQKVILASLPILEEEKFFEMLMFPMQIDA